MSTIFTKTIKNRKMNLEIFNSANECVHACETREITDTSFDDMHESRRITRDSKWYGGIKSYSEALDLLKTGYQPTVDSMRGVFKAKASGDGKRFRAQNNVVGFAPIVPLALKGVPNCMMDMRMTPIKAKVLDIFVDMTCGAGTSASQITEASKKVLSAVVELERQGYRFNIYVGSSYCDSKGVDAVGVRVKAAEHPLDLKRVSFPMTHTAFFRVIGFDWYSRFPLGTYRFGYGRAAYFEFKNESSSVFKTLFGKKNLVYFSVQELVKGSDKDTIIKEVLENGNSKD